MYAAHKIDDEHISKTAHKLFILRDEKERRLATLSGEGAYCLLKAFQLDKHIPNITLIEEGERMGCWLGDGVYIEGKKVTAFTLERQTWYCYSS